MKRILSIIAVFFSTIIFAQTTVTGTVSDDNNDPIPGANIVLDAMNGTVADFDGNFTIVVNQNPPFTLTVSSVGFDSATINVTSESLNFDVQLVTSQNLLDEIVVNASRVPERLFESTVTVEKFDFKDIAQSTGPDFYSSLQSLKGVQINQGGLLLQQVNTRGFSTVYNEGFVQLVDGMNNEAPGLSFAAGNLLGIHELDIQSVELMPGAASALYGANAIKGILFMNSKNPFDFPGVSVAYRHGVTSQKAAGENYYYDIAMRAANVFSDKFAAKMTVSYTQGEDWHAADYRDINHFNNNLGGLERWQHNSGTAAYPDNFTKHDARDFPLYNGINVFGELPREIDMDAAFAGLVLPQLVQQGLLPAAAVAPLSQALTAFPYFGMQTINTSGYNENVLQDNNASSLKADIALHFKPTEDSEIIWNSKLGSGNTMLHSTSRYVLKNFALQQHKLEYKNKNFNAKWYTSIESAGDTHDISLLGANMVLAQPGGGAAWYGAYLNNYFGLSGIYGLAPGANGNAVAGLTTILGDIQGAIPGRPINSRSFASLVPNTIPIHGQARKVADQNLLQPGSDGWNKQYAKSLGTGASLFGGGAGIFDNSKSTSVELNYNLQDLVNLEDTDIIVGGSYREYELRSNGFLFTDYDSPISYVDMGLYAQATKQIGALKLNASMRYDKSEYFDGHLTPRIGALLFLSENQNVRFSYQTGYQNPSAQDQYIGLDITQTIFMGTSPDSVNRFKKDVFGVSAAQAGKRFTITGPMVMENSYMAAQFLAGNVVKADLDFVEPQYVKSYDFGYRVNGKKSAFDLNVYWTEWDNFIAAKNVLAPMYIDQPGGAVAAIAAGDYRIMSVDSNTDEVVNTYGVTAGFETSLFKLFDFSAIYEYNEMDFDNPDSDFEPGFNTPENKYKVSLGSTKLAENFAFNVSARYQDSFLWQQSGFVDAMVPACTVVDASMNFELPKIKGNIKVGATNLSGNDYMPFIGTGWVGSQYYVGFTLNP